MLGVWENELYFYYKPLIQAPLTIEGLELAVSFLRYRYTVGPTTD